MPLVPPEVFRLEGGNQTLPDAFTTRLGERVRLGCPVTGIERGESGVRVRYREAGQDKTIDADWLVSAMSLGQLRQVPVTPAWPEARRDVVNLFPYYTASRPVFQSRTRFWEKDGVSPNMILGERDAGAHLADGRRRGDVARAHRGHRRRLHQRR